MIPIILQVSNVNETIQNRNFRIFDGKPQIEYLISRIINEVDDTSIVISTSDLSRDDIFEDVTEKYGIGIVRGKYENILERLYSASKMLNQTDVVRLSAKYPLIDLTEMTKLYDSHCASRSDFSYNEHVNGVMMGTGCEVFSVDFVRQLLNKELNKVQQETIASYIIQCKEPYTINKYICDETRPSYKLDFETEKDYEVISEIIQNVDIISNANIKDYLNKHKVLSKYNLEAPPREVGLDKLYLHPDKIKSILENKFDNSYPVSIELTLTNACNLKCVYCSDMELRERQGVDKTIEPETLEKLFSDLAKGGTKGITFEGGGEPTLYKHFGRAVESAKNAGLACGLITNGTVRLPKDVLKQFEWIRVSLDASTESEYYKLKGVDCFEKVISNIAYYIEYCPTVGVGYVATNQNVSEIETLVMRLREIKASYIQIRPVVDCEDLYPSDVDLSYLKFYQNKNFGVLVEGMKENANSGNLGLPCVANGLTSIISGDGSVYLCGRLNIYDWLEPIGNINEKSFYDIWNGEIRKEQSELVLERKFCNDNCPQCRISKFNKLFDSLNNINSKNFI